MDCENLVDNGRIVNNEPDCDDREDQKRETQCLHGALSYMNPPIHPTQIYVENAQPPSQNRNVYEIPPHCVSYPPPYGSYPPPYGSYPPYNFASISGMYNSYGHQYFGDGSNYSNSQKSARRLDFPNP